jgi:hypothetical protein
MLIVSGGPSIDVNINDKFFNMYPYIDFAMYGAGEQSFADLIESILKKKKLIAFNTSNIAWIDKEKNKVIIADFKYVPQHKVSPYLHNKEFFSQMISDLHQKGIEVVIPYELTRGCPYSCTFCDWNSGLTNKVSRRKGTYKDEIDLFHHLEIKKIYLSDANVGQYDEDVDMISYLANKNINESAGFQIDGNFSKLRKENNLKIYNLIGEANLSTEHAGFTLSVQDINVNVLQNIDRPDVGWDVHLNIINELHKKFPNKHCKIQLIQGLPGQTVISWRETLSEICKHPVTIQPFISELLSASPAARDKDYQNNFKFEYSNSERSENKHFFRGAFPKSCTSFSQLDFVKMTMYTIIYTTLQVYKKQGIEFNLEGVVDEFIGSKNYNVLVDNLYQNWKEHDKFYFTLDLDLKENIVTASNFTESVMDWMDSVLLLKLVLNNSLLKDKKEFIRKAVMIDHNKQFKLNMKKLKAF